jgi:hypothetical protein
MSSTSPFIFSSVRSTSETATTLRRLRARSCASWMDLRTLDKTKVLLSQKADM